MTRALLIDSGNTRVKWAFADTLPGGVAHAPHETLDDLRRVVAQADAIWIASVAGDEKDALLRAALAEPRVCVQWLRATGGECGVSNGYMHPERLGVDRWMALIGARARTSIPALVVSIGTAMTVDALDADGLFLGGVIVPGLRLMRESLAAGTAGVGIETGGAIAFPRTTVDAVASGTMAALAGAIRHQYENLQKAMGRPVRCLLTGGDATALLPRLELDCEHAPALVLEGIRCVARTRSRG